MLVLTILLQLSIDDTSTLGSANPTQPCTQLSYAIRQAMSEGDAHSHVGNIPLMPSYTTSRFSTNGCIDIPGIAARCASTPGAGLSQIPPNFSSFPVSWMLGPGPCLVEQDIQARGWELSVVAKPLLLCALPT